MKNRDAKKIQTNERQNKQQTLTQIEAAEILGLTEKKLEEFVDRGEILALEIQGQNLFCVNELVSWMERRCWRFRIDGEDESFGGVS